MKEKEKENINPNNTLEVLAYAAYARFHGQETYKRSSEPYNVYQACEDVIIENNLNPVTLSLTLINSAGIDPASIRELTDSLVDKIIYDKERISRKSLALEVATFMLGRKVKQLYPDTEIKEQERFDKYGETFSS